MADIVLTTLNAKYIHAAFGLRYLLANLGPLRSRAAIVEFDIHQRPVDVAEVLLSHNPKIIGLGVYIWNVAPLTEVVAALKRVRPDVTIILGGPEVSYETEAQFIVQLADHVIAGEADLKFAEVCRVLLQDTSEKLPATSGRQPEFVSNEARLLPSLEPERPLTPPLSPSEGERVSFRTGEGLPKIIPAEPPEFSQLALPYDLYTADDIAHRVIYVEASRGCPFDCEFCLSSLDIPVRQAPLPAFLAEMQKLLDRGVRQFKFVDRTFNLNIATSRAILEFFLQRHQPGHFYHFEMIPDRLPAELREIVARFPPGALQFEVGIQTFNADVAERIQRRQNYERLEENFRFLRTQTGAHIHADLIFGLPGESLESFAAGFDRLVALAPQEIQVGILKRLRGTPIMRHDAEWQMIYNPHPPYEVLQNRLVDFATTQRIRRFARYWDLVGNSGNFVETTPLIWSGGVSPFYAFLRWSDWLHTRVGRTDSIALVRLMELLFEYLTGDRKLDRARVAEAMSRDYLRGNRRDIPEFLKAFSQRNKADTPTAQRRPVGSKRQARHLRPASSGG